MSPTPEPEGRTAVVEPPARIAAVIVTYNSADHLPGLLASLASQTCRATVDAIAVDNHSQDSTLAVLAEHQQVTVHDAGANLGYAGGINVALDHVGAADAVLLLNPDLRLDRLAIEAMWQRLRQPGVGAVVPRILTAEGELSRSLRFEPTILRCLGETILGSRLGRRRPRWSTEMELSWRRYEEPHAVDWATGACIMLRGDVARQVGAWDERFFLYSEETDYLRRVREASWQVWYEPESRVTHAGRGSGSSSILIALELVNKVRYVEKRSGRAYAEVVRAITVLGCLARPHRPGRKEALGYLVRRSSWARLPAAPHSDRPASPSGPVAREAAYGRR